MQTSNTWLVWFACSMRTMQCSKKTSLLETQREKLWLMRMPRRMQRCSSLQRTWLGCRTWKAWKQMERAPCMARSTSRRSLLKSKLLSQMSSRERKNSKTISLNAWDKMNLTMIGFLGVKRSIELATYLISLPRWTSTMQRISCKSVKFPCLYKSPRTMLSPMLTWTRDLSRRPT